ncbi:MAG: hypothetical protein ACFE0Q_03305 [Anaerolineae bacterium]
MQIFQEFILSQWLIMIALFVVFIAISRWALVTLKEYPGYALGWMIGLFFIIVRLSLGDAPAPDGANAYLDGFQVFIATVMGLVVGSVILFGLRFGMQYARAVALQIAIYTAMNIIMIFLVFISTPITQKMIGIFALAIAIATLFAMVLFPSPEREEELNIRSQGATGQQNPPNSQSGALNTSRLNKIRQSQNQKLNR